MTTVILSGSEGSVHHGVAAEVCGAQQGNLFIGRGGFHHGVHEPGGAQGGRVLQRRIIAVQHHVAGVEGVQDRSVRSHPIGHVLQLGGLAQLLVQAVDFSGKVVLDKVLIPLQLGRRIATHILVVVGGHGGVENVHREVQDAVVGVCIGLYHLVHRALHEGFAEVLGGGEMVRVEVALAGGEKICQDKEADEQNRYPAAPEAGKGLGVLRLPLGREGPEKQAGGEGNQEEGAEGIGLEEGDAVGHEGLYQHILHLGVGGRLEVPEQAGGQPGQQAEAAGESEGPSQAFPEGLLGVLLLEDAVQGEEAQHRQGHLQHHQRHGYRPELVIKR